MTNASVRVTPLEVFQYGTDLTGDDRLTAIGGTPMQDVSQNAITGFSHTTSTSASGHTTAPVLPIPEAVGLLRMNGRNLSDLQSFLADLAKGLLAIQSAATVMAVTYASADKGSADSIGAVAYAFNDSLTPPAGLSTKGWSTMSAQQAALPQAAAAAGDTALLNNASTVTREGDTLIYNFPDGSVLRVQNVTVDGRYQRTATEIIGADGKPVQAVSDSRVISDDGTVTTTHTTVAGPVTSSVTTEVKPDGSTVITTTVPDDKGQPRTTTQTYHPQPPEPAQASGDAPVTDYAATNGGLQPNPYDPTVWGSQGDQYWKAAQDLPAGQG